MAKYFYQLSHIALVVFVSLACSTPECWGNIDINGNQNRVAQNVPEIVQMMLSRHPEHTESLSQKVNSEEKERSTTKTEKAPNHEGTAEEELSKEIPNETLRRIRATEKFSFKSQDISQLRTLLKDTMIAEATPEDVRKVLSNKAVQQLFNTLNPTALKNVINAASQLPPEKLKKLQASIFSGGEVKIPSIKVTRNTLETEEQKDTEIKAQPKASDTRDPLKERFESPQTENLNKFDLGQDNTDKPEKDFN